MVTILQPLIIKHYSNEDGENKIVIEYPLLRTNAHKSDFHLGKTLISNTSLICKCPSQVRT